MLVVPRVRSTRSANGFTLVELLVVVGIIAVLISILLPSLAGARRAANTLNCESNLRQVGIAMLMYAQQNNGAIPGNGWTSSAFLYNIKGNKNYNCPNVCQVWDWQAPLAKLMGLQFDEGYTLASRQSRFLALCQYGPFQCAENDILAPPYASSPIQVVAPLISYNTALIFQMAYGSGDVTRFQKYINTGTYRPNLNKIGTSAAKIFMCDGGRWNDGSVVGPPDYNLSWDGSGQTGTMSPGGAYSDYGPWSAYTRAFAFTPNLTALYSMRHGARTQTKFLSELKFDALYFDGHVETLTAQEGMNPSLWMPKGTILPQTEMCDTAKEFYLPPGATQLNIAQ